MSIIIYNLGPLAQLVAHRTFNPLVPGSSPGCSTRKICMIELFAIVCLGFVLWLGLKDAVNIMGSKDEDKE